MNRRTVQVGLVLGVFGTFAAGVPGCGEKARYTSGGRTAAFWAEELKQTDVERRRKAAIKIGPLMIRDPSAFTATVGALKDEDSAVRLAAIRALRIYCRSKLSEADVALGELAGKDPDDNVRAAAAKARAELGRR